MLTSIFNCRDMNDKNRNKKRPSFWAFWRRKRCLEVNKLFAQATRLSFIYSFDVGGEMLTKDDRNAKGTHIFQLFEW